MTPVFMIDGKSYDVFVPEGGIKRTVNILDGDKAGRLQNGQMQRDIVGAFYTYEVQIDTLSLSKGEYDSLFEVLSSPVDSHSITMPYGQSTVSFNAYCTAVSDTLDNMQNGNQWGDLTVSFISMGPNR